MEKEAKQSMMLYSADLVMFFFNCAQKKTFFGGSVQKYYYYVQKYCLFWALCRNITGQEPRVPGVPCRAIFGACEEILVSRRTQKYSPLNIYFCDG